ncbi:MAG: threonine synthase [Spirochaetia bacterium]|nr:threonine synthase [Spirochaetia bacterium]
MATNAYFQCISGCDEKHGLDEVIYRCPKCNNLLEVIHNLDELKKKSADEWKETFENRYKSNEFPYSSGVWGKKEWVLPGIKNEDIVSLGEGATHLFKTAKLDELFNQDVYVKLCGNSHTGSFKDLGMTVLVSQVNAMIKSGRPIKAIACASTGDTSAALAAYAASAGIQCVILLPKNKISLAQLIQPVSNNAIVLSLDTDFDGCMNLVQKLTTEKEIYLANSMNSLRIEGQKTVGIEIIQQLNWQVPDWFVIPGGNLGNVSALGNGITLLYELGMINKMPRIALAQAQKANPLYLSYQNNFEEFHPMQAGKTLASAIQIGNPVSVNKAIRALKKFNGVVEQASEEELANAAALADKSGLLADPHTGVALAALIKLKEKNIISKNESVAVISTANGLKFADFKVKYHEDTLEDINIRYQNKPVEIKADISEIQKIVNKKLEKNK